MAKRGFFDLGKAINNVRKANGVADTGLASLSLISKGVFNVARFAVTEGIDQFIKSSGKVILDQDKATNEQKEKVRDNIARAEARQAERAEKDRQWEQDHK